SHAVPTERYRGWSPSGVVASRVVATGLGTLDTSIVNLYFSYDSRHREETSSDSCSNHAGGVAAFGRLNDPTANTTMLARKSAQLGSANSAVQFIAFEMPCASWVAFIDGSTSRMARNECTSQNAVSPTPMIESMNAASGIQDARFHHRPP